MVVVVAEEVNPSTTNPNPGFCGVAGGSGGGTSFPQTTAGAAGNTPPTTPLKEIQVEHLAQHQKVGAGGGGGICGAGGDGSPDGPGPGGGAGGAGLNIAPLFPGSPITGVGVEVVEAIMILVRQQVLED